MEKRRDFGLKRKKLDVDKIIRAMKASTSLAHANIPNDSETEGTPLEVDLRFRKENKDYVNSNCFRKTTAPCKGPGTDATQQSWNFDIGDKSKWGEALPLFDGDDPVEGTEENFDEIVYSKLAKLNEMQKITTEHAEGKFRKKHKFFANWELMYTVLKLAFKLILVGIFGAILYAIYNVNNPIY